MSLTCCLMLPVLAAAAPSSSPPHEMRVVTVHPRDNGAALRNPGMGWVFHYYDNVPAHYGSRLAPSDTLDDFPGLTVIYLRIPWSYIEPEEGQFNWSVLDTPAQRWIDKGLQVAFRFTCSESWMRYATPEWVRKAGARGYEFKPGKGVTEDGPFWELDYNDPVFLEKLDHFLAAAAKRYDGNPHVAFIDVGSFGVWGEGHTYSSTRLPYSAETVIRHIDLHLKHFRHTLLAANDDFVSQGRGERTIEHARDHGLTLRDDSILVQKGERAYFHDNLAQWFWKKHPVILECEHYGPSKARGCWEDGSRYLQAVEDYHASYVSIHWWPYEFLEENRDLVRRINMRLGYRLQPITVTWPEKVAIGGTLRISQTWRNAGVAPCLPGGFPAITLKDEKDGIAAVFVEEQLDVRDLPVGKPGAAPPRTVRSEFLLPFSLAGGRYKVYVSIGDRDGTPRIALPLDGDDGHRRYLLGEISIEGDFAVSGPVRLNASPESMQLRCTWTTHHALHRAVLPFCHFERNGRIVFYGFAPDADATRIRTEGRHTLTFSFQPPRTERNAAFKVYVGLWRPDRVGRSDERLRPDRGQPDRRVFLGTLRIDGDGRCTFEPAQ